MINHDESWQVWVDKNQGCVIIIYRFEFHAKNIPIKLLKFLRTFLPLIFLFRWFFLIQKRPQMMDSFRSDLEICFNKKSEITTKKYPRVPEVKVMLGFIFNCVIAHQRLGLPRHTKFPFLLSHILKLKGTLFLKHSWKDQSVEFSRVNVSMRRIPRVWRKEARGLSLLSAYVWPTFPTD